MNAIDMIINEYQAKVEAERVEHERQLAEMLERGEAAARAALPEYFGEAWDVISPHVELKERKRTGANVTCEFWVDGGELGITGFHVWVKVTQNGRVEIGRWADPHLDLAAFFAERRKDFYDHQVDGAVRQLREAGTDDLAERALDQLIELAPEREEKWRQAFDERIRILDYQRIEGEAIRSYEAAYRTYLGDVQTKMSANRKNRDELQNELDETREMWVLEYGLGIVTTNDGDREFTGSQMVLVSTDEPLGGYFDELVFGDWVKRKYINPIRITPIDVSPLDGRWPFGRLNTPGGVLCFWPEDRELAKRLIDETLWCDLPKEPEAPEGISDNRARGIRYEVSFEMSQGEEQEL